MISPLSCTGKNRFIRLFFFSLTMLLLNATVQAESLKKVKIWDIDSNDILVSREITVKTSQYNPRKILSYICKDNPGLDPEVVLVKNGIAIVNMAGNDALITEQSGTTGAWHWAARVVFNLTEFPDIETVYFVDLGSHFSPGESSRMDYWPLMDRAMKLSYKSYVESWLGSEKTDYIYRFKDYLQEVGDTTTINLLLAIQADLDISYDRFLMEFIDEIVEAIRNK